MIAKEEKIFIIDAYLKELNCDKYVFNNKVTPDSTQEEVAEINASILFIDQKIQAVESEKIKINQGE